MSADAAVRVTRAAPTPTKPNKTALPTLADLPVMLTVLEAAAVLRVARFTMYRTHLNRPGGLKAVRVGGRRLIRRTDLERYIERLAA